MKAAVNSKLKAAGKDELTPGVFKTYERKDGSLKMRPDFAKREVNEASPAARKSAVKFFRWPCLTPPQHTRRDRQRT